MFTGVKAGQPVTHMRATNSKPQPSKQFHMNKFLPAHYFLFDQPWIYVTIGLDNYRNFSFMST